MDAFLKKLTARLRQHFEGCEIEWERAAENRFGGVMIWEGFVGMEQIKRQRILWRTLDKELSSQERPKIAVLLTMTPEEMASAREG